MRCVLRAPVHPQPEAYAMGKSALAVNMSINAAKNGATVGIFSLEMSREQLAHRILTAEAEILTVCI